MKTKIKPTAARKIAFPAAVFCLQKLKGGLFFMICVNTENGIKYRMVIGRESRKAVYRP